MIFAASVLGAALAQDSPASVYGCSLSGCSPGRSSFVDAPGSAPPITNASGVALAWKYAPADAAPDPPGCATPNLGCSTNGNVIVCAMRAADGLLCLSTEGAALWNSSDVSGLSPHFRGGPPVVDDLGQTAASDGDSLVYHKGDGTLLWSQTISDKGAGARFSPTATSTKLYPLTLGNGHYAAYQPAQGMCWASLALGASRDDPDIFDAPVTPAAARGERTFVLTGPHGGGAGRLQKLYAVDATLSEGNRLQVKWTQPLCGLAQAPAAPVALPARGSVGDSTQVLFFGAECGGEGAEAAAGGAGAMQLISMLDAGGEAAPQRMWAAGTAGMAEGSPMGLVWDGGDAVWAYDGGAGSSSSSSSSSSSAGAGAAAAAAGAGVLRAFNLTDGSAAGTVALDALGPPRSRAVVARDPATGHAVLTACFGADRASAVMAAVDLRTGATLWKHQDAHATTVGQPVLANGANGFPVLAFVNEDGAVAALVASA